MKEDRLDQKGVGSTYTGSQTYTRLSRSKQRAGVACVGCVGLLRIRIIEKKTRAHIPIYGNRGRSQTYTTYTFDRNHLIPKHLSVWSTYTQATPNLHLPTPRRCSRFARRGR